MLLDMKKLLATLVLTLGACGTDPPHTSCSVQAEQACDPADTECVSAVMDDCVPPVCEAPPGQHC